jgi:hypothetical protein
MMMMMMMKNTQRSGGAVSSEVLKLWAPPGEGAVGPRGERALVVCVSHIFILNEIWAQDKMYTLVRTLLGSNTLLTTQYRL